MTNAERHAGATLLRRMPASLQQAVDWLRTHPETADAELAALFSLVYPQPANLREAAHALGCYEPLSRRERHVLRLIAAGCSNQEIAGALLVSLNTVKTHIKRIYAKLQVHNRVSAVERARALGMVRMKDEG